MTLRSMAIRLLGLASILALVLSPPPVTASDNGMAAANEVSEASYYDFMNNYLRTHTFDNRGPTGGDLIPCRDNILSLFQSYGLAASLEAFTYSGGTYHNVVGQLTGTVDPTRIYIIGSHYDSVSNPGADDNASGTALVLEAARVLSQYDSAYTIRFIAFSMEEVGLVGSEAYVNSHWTEDIRGMVSADMVAYNTGPNYVNIYGRTASNPIKNSLAAAVAEYGEGLSYVIGGDTPASDHAPFEAEGFQACLLIEGEVWENPYYHTSQDNFEQPGNLDFPFATRCTRSAVGWLVDQAGVIVDANYLEISFPAGRPDFASPAGGTLVHVAVAGAGTDIPLAGSGLLHYDTGGGWLSAPLQDVGGQLYAVLPAAACGAEIAYYITFANTLGEVYLSPSGAPVQAYSATAAYGSIPVFADNFQTNLGWTTAVVGATSGTWQRGVPVNDPSWEYDPATDGDGSGQCYLTQNQTGNTDVDNGSVRLISPILDLSAGGAMLSYEYYLYLTDDDGVDKLLVEISSNGSSGPWTTIAQHTTDGGLSWRHHEITPANFAAAGVTLTSNMQLRFTANDGGTQSIVEAGVDGLLITTLDCTLPFVPGDMNCDGAVTFADINPFVDALLDPVLYQQHYPNCDPLRGDLNDNGVVGFEDINPFVNLLLT